MMKVKIRGKVYDGEREPVMVILTDDDKVLIASMAPSDTKYCCFPEGMDFEQIKEFMKNGKDTMEVKITYKHIWWFTMALWAFSMLLRLLRNA